MEMAGSEVANVPKSYSLNMFKDIVPMCVFSETNQGANLTCIFLFPSSFVLCSGILTSRDTYLQVFLPCLIFIGF